MMKNYLAVNRYSEVNLNDTTRPEQNCPSNHAVETSRPGPRRIGKKT
jgi:hypothetical protein